MLGRISLIPQILSKKVSASPREQSTRVVPAAIRQSLIFNPLVVARQTRKGCWLWPSDRRRFSSKSAPPPPPNLDAANGSQSPDFTGSSSSSQASNGAKNNPNEQASNKGSSSFVKALTDIDTTRVRVIQSADESKFRVPVAGTTGLLSQAEVKPSSIKQVVVLEVGDEGSRQHGYFYFTEDQYVLSPWHDVPLYPIERVLQPDKAANLVNMVVAMPKYTSQRFEIKVQHSHTPLGPEYSAPKHALLKPHPRYNKWDSYFFNEGVLSQTWTDPEELALDTKWPGHDGPLHVCEIGSAALERGQLLEVKILGVLGIIQRPFLVWKLIAINSQDPKASLFEDITDVEDHCPGLLDEIREFYRMYETPEGRPAYEFVFSGEFKDKTFAMEVVRQGYECWRLGCETNWDIGRKDPSLHFKWFAKSVENLMDADGPLSEVARRGKK